MATSYSLLLLLLVTMVTANSNKPPPKKIVHVGVNPLSASACDGKLMCHSDFGGPVCIDKVMACDGQRQCTNGLDEIGCESMMCEDNGQIRCNDNTCGTMCDDIYDCPGSEDERSCKSQCPPGRFQCGDGKCLPLKLVCDGLADCSAKDDEIGCSKQCRCGPEHYLCDDGKTCLPFNALCNNIKECPHGDDEKYCSRGCKCKPGEYLCLGGQSCIKQDQLCDNAILNAWKYQVGIYKPYWNDYFIPRRDCPAGDDEGCQQLLRNIYPVR